MKMDGLYFCNIDGTDVYVNKSLFHNITEEEVTRYVHYIREKKNIDNKNTMLAAVSISLIDDKNISLDYCIKPRSFERIRRITGYLVGDLSKWNNGKLAEEHDRVKHSIE